VLLYTNDGLSEKEINSPIYNNIKNILCLGINLAKEVKHCYTENYKLLMKEIKDTNKWKDISYSWMGRQYS